MRSARMASATPLRCTIPQDNGYFGIDNAHMVRASRGPGGRSSVVRDHLHRGESVRPYIYSDADTLADDFWREVDAVLKKEGIE